MKKFIQFFSVLSLALAFGVVAANAQSSSRVSADIPFDFSVGQKQFTAGTYKMRITKLESNGGYVTILDEAGKGVATIVGTGTSYDPYEKSSLIFKVSGNNRSLSEVVLKDTHLIMPVKRRQQQLGTTVGKADVVEVPVSTVN